MSANDTPEEAIASLHEDNSPRRRAMQLEDYFDFQTPADIRIKGHRIGIEAVLYEYIYNAKTPEEIATRFPTLTLEEVYATLLYYHHNREQIDRYIADWLEFGRQQREEQARNPSPAILKLRRFRAERERQPV